MTLSNHMLNGKTVLITGAAGGIGFEAARVFAEMGANVLIADINQEKGTRAAASINEQCHNCVSFLNIDLSNEAETVRLCEDILSKYNCPDIIFNNAATVITGRIGAVNMTDWEMSYAVNLKAPILLTAFFLEHMKKRDSGCIVFVSSSGAAPYLSTYETFKTAQVEFSNALSMELEGTHIYTYTIGPGLVRTQTAEKSITAVAASMGITIDEFYRQNETHILDVVDAGTGFAISVLNASEYHGQEISSIQALNHFNYQTAAPALLQKKTTAILPTELLIKTINTFNTQYDGWQNRNIFERQWVLRDFKKYVGISADTAHKELAVLKGKIDNGETQMPFPEKLFENLLRYWENQLKLLQGFEKDKEKLADYSQTIREWISDVQTLLTMIK